MNKLRNTPERIEQMSNSDRVEAAVKMYTQKDNSATQQEIANLFGISRSSIKAQLIQWIEDEIDLNRAVTKDRVKKRVCTMYTERVGKPRDSVSDDWWHDSVIDIQRLNYRVLAQGNDQVLF
ncbi:hypothetical protein ACTFIW_010005 [Dictyostelium discoideum]